MKTSALFTVPLIVVIGSASLASADPTSTSNEAEQTQVAEADLSFLERIALLKQPAIVLPQSLSSSSSDSLSASASSALASAVQNDDSEEAAGTTDDDDESPSTIDADEASALVSKAWAAHATHTYDGTGTPGMIDRPTPTYTPPAGAAKRMRRSNHKNKPAHGHAHNHKARHQVIAEPLARRNATVAAEVHQEQVANNGTATQPTATARGYLTPAHTITFDVNAESDASDSSAATPPAIFAAGQEDFRKRAKTSTTSTSAKKKRKGKKTTAKGVTATPVQKIVVKSSTAKTTSTKRTATKAQKHATNTRIAQNTTTSKTKSPVVAAAVTTSNAAASAPAVTTSPTTTTYPNGRLSPEEAESIASRLWAQRSTHTYDGTGTPGFIDRPTPTFVPYTVATPNAGARLVKRLKEMLYIE